MTSAPGTSKIERLRIGPPQSQWSTVVPRRDADEGAGVMPSLTPRIGLRPDHLRASFLDQFRAAAPAARAISQEASDR
jgi:hypothetical protein